MRYITSLALMYIYVTVTDTVYTECELTLGYFYRGAMTYSSMLLRKPFKAMVVSRKILKPETPLTDDSTLTTHLPLKLNHNNFLV